MKKTPSLLPPVLLAQEVAEIRESLAAWRAALHHADTTTSTNARDYLPATLWRHLHEGGEITSLRSEAAAGKFTPDKMRQLIDRLEVALHDVRTIEITLAHTPSQTLESSILAWTRATLAPPVAVQIVVDPAIVGGASIAFEGKVYNYSLARSLSQYEILPRLS